MAGFPPSARALKRVVAGFRSELAPILSLEMAASDVQANHSKHATRKPVTVRTFVTKQGVFVLSVMSERLLESAAIGLANITF